MSRRSRRSDIRGCVSVTSGHYSRPRPGRIGASKGLGLFPLPLAGEKGGGGVKMPVRQPSPVSRRKAAAHRAPEVGTSTMSKTVMIVEDNELNMKLFHDRLEAHGYDTVATGDGFKVPDLARKHRPDLILMDIQLPEVSGLEVTKWLKEDPELQAIPVVAVTAFAMKGDEERIREGGCEAYLSKPISVGKFIETIRRFLAVPQGDRR